MLRLLSEISHAWIENKLSVVGWHYARQVGLPLCPRNILARVRPPFSDTNYTIKLEEPVDTLRAINLFSVRNPWSKLNLPAAPKVIIDLGANTGLSSLYWKSRFPTATVFGVEMDEYNFKRCNALFTNNGLKPHFFHLAIAGRDGPVSYKLHAAHGQHRLTQLCDQRFAWENKDIQVPGLTFRSFLDRHGFVEVDLLKVDIEGAEQFLAESVSEWSKHVRQLLLEIHHNIDQKWARETFSSAGFDIVNSDDSGRTEWFCVNRLVNNSRGQFSE